LSIRRSLVIAHPRRRGHPTDDDRADRQVTHQNESLHAASL
jgi:hypothetical protein